MPSVFSSISSISPILVVCCPTVVDSSLTSCSSCATPCLAIASTDEISISSTFVSIVFNLSSMLSNEVINSLALLVISFNVSTTLPPDSLVNILSALIN